jgi:flagellar hook-basal body complex protein FliE
MSMTIGPVTPIRIPEVQAPGATGGKSGFQDVLESAIQQVQSSQQNASESVQKFLSGETEDLHTAALAVQRAEMEFDLFMQVRNKVVSAYQEVMRMQL